MSEPRTARQALDFVNLLDLMKHPERWPKYPGQPDTVLALSKGPWEVGLILSINGNVNPIVWICDVTLFRASKLKSHSKKVYNSLGDIIRDGWTEMQLQITPNFSISANTDYYNSPISYNNFVIDEWGNNFS